MSEKCDLTCIEDSKYGQKIENRCKKCKDEKSDFFLQNQNDSYDFQSRE